LYFTSTSGRPFYQILGISTFLELLIRSAINCSPSLADCWAKTDPFSGKPALTIRDHCLIVGAVAEEVRRLLPIACEKLKLQGAVTLAAAHDIGKLSPGFLLKARPYWDFPGALGQTFYEGNHAKVSQAHLASLPAARVGTRPFNWVLAAGGHHGKYPSASSYLGKIAEDGLEWPSLLRNELLAELESVFGKLPTEDLPRGPMVHWLTGFITFADWIGSDTRWFPVIASGSLADHETPNGARHTAAAAVAEIGWNERRVRQGMEFEELFPGVEKPRPLQSALIAAMDAPGLYIVEAPMGVGKTEAALAGCYRRWKEGGERGLYFALPTQLTSNRIYERVSTFLANVAVDPIVASLVHGNAWMNPDRIVKVMPTVEGERGAADLTDWYVSGRKSMLAAFATGTIDQAIMSCLPVKHSSLRLFALSGKMVIIDEVHSYDAYTSALVDRTVAWLLEVGCSVIVLSATLSSGRRKSLVRAGGAEEREVSSVYPLITKVARGGEYSEVIPVDVNKSPSSRVLIERVFDTNEEYWQNLADAAEAGACVLIIRNTVALAQETYREIKSRCRDSGILFGLLHSRFPQFKRDLNEQAWMDQLGNDGNYRPKGCILVATQVVEQSVDIDADLLVTDLAPVDLILQRLGRLHRHERQRPVGFEQPRCIILMPSVDWNGDPKVIKTELGPSGFVYPPFSLFQASRIISHLRDGCIMLPQDIRPLVEDACCVPSTLQAGAAFFHDELEKETTRMLATARLFDVFQSPSEDDKEGAKTRWNDVPTSLLVLLRQAPSPASTHLEFLNGERVPFGYGPFNYLLALALHRNAIKVPRYLVRHAETRQPSWLEDQIQNAVLGVVDVAGTACDLVGCDETPIYLLFYHETTGLSHTRNTAAPMTYTLDPADDDSWF
jgi:CRISPR-associated endonuclease/helicase Cas3